MASANLLSEIANPVERQQRNTLRDQQISANEQNMDIAAQKQKQAQAAAELERIANVLQSATTPEQWERAIGFLEQEGIELDPHERDFSARDMLINQAVSVKDQIAQGIDIQRANAATMQAEAAKTRAGSVGTSAGVKPMSPEGKRQHDINAGIITAEQAKPAKKAISVGERKMKRESENAIVDLSNTLETLKRARQLAPDTFEGFGASARGALGAKLPDAVVPDFIADPETGKTTQEFINIMSPAAIQQMADTLKGATTNFELNEFKAILADPAQPAELKIRTIDRMMKLAQDQLALEQERIREFEGEATPAAEPEEETATFDNNRAQILQEAQEALDAGADPELVIQRLQEAGIEPEELQ